jgi:hypothetical protein
MGLLARIAAQEGGPMDPELYGGIDLLGPGVVAQAEAFAAKVPPALRAELGALLREIDNASHMRTLGVCDHETVVALKFFGIAEEAWWGLVDGLPPAEMQRGR